MRVFFFFPTVFALVRHKYSWSKKKKAAAPHNTTDPLMSRCCFQDAAKELHELNIKQKSNCKFPDCDEPMSCPHCAVCLLGENKSCLLFPPIFMAASGDRHETFHLYLYNHFLPQQHSLLSILAPLSPQAEGSPFMTIW